jgi:exodeoxyribonuclease VII large subunit
LDRDVRRDLKERARRLKDLGSLLESVSHKSVLKRGYAVVRDDKNRPVTSIAAVRPGVPLDIELKDGHIGAVAAGKPIKKRPPPGGGSDQGSLV